MKTADLIRKIDAAWFALDHECNRSTELRRCLDRAYEHALTGEKEHRAMGGRWLQRRPSEGYRISTMKAARFMVLKWVTSDTFPRPESWTFAAGTRTDILFSLAIRELLQANAPEVLGHLRDFGFEEVEYGQDIAIPA